MSQDILDNSTYDNHLTRQKKASLVVNLGLFANALLAIAKLLAGIFGRSQALLADGVNSFSDVIYFIVVKAFVKLSGKPADKEHPYGHYQYETIGALVVGAFVITTGIAIFWNSINSAVELLTNKDNIESIKSYSIYIALITIAIKIFLLIHSIKIAKQTNNMAVSALAKDHRNDIFSAIGVTIGIILSLKGFFWADPLAGAIVAIIVAKSGFDILREASDDLMDNVPSDEITNKVHNILKDNPDVKCIQEVHAHRFGPYLVINITICLDGTLTIKEADKISDELEKLLTQKINLLRKVYVHYHPYNLNKS